MNRIISFLLGLFLSYAVFAEPCDRWPAWFKSICLAPYNAWTKGGIELYFTGYAWHNRYTYPESRLKTYNEAAWGGGIGQGYLNQDKGDWSTLYAMAFLDSHKNIEPLAGFAFLKTAPFLDYARAGIGYTLFITARPDIFKGRPFPGALPLVSLSYRRLSLFATYIPAAQNAGNVLFLFGKYAFE